MRCVRLVVCAGLALWSMASPLLAVQGRPLKVLTTFLPVYCFAANVAGDFAQVQNLLPANVEPHDYQFSRKDLQKLSDADLVFANGLGLESWLDKALGITGGLHAPPVVEISAGLEPELILNPAFSQPTSLHGPRPSVGVSRFSYNPHFWLDPRLAARAVTNILRALQAADPAHAGEYASNAAAYVARLEKLDRELQVQLAPVRGASIITYHDAFPYFARRYGLQVMGVVEAVADVEPSLKYLAGLYRSARASEVRAIFAEPPSVPRLARQIGRDLGLPVGQLDTLEAGALEAGAYEKAMLRNGQTLLNYLNQDASRLTR